MPKYKIVEIKLVNKILLLVMMLTFTSQYAHAFDFSNSNSSYDYSQTVEIYIVDLKESKLFGMYDPFEIRVTTIPSRFYVAVLGAVTRGHRNEFGVEIINGAAVGAVFVVIFRSPGNSHILHVGPNWIADGNKQILLSAEENRSIYEVLVQRTASVEPNDLKVFEGLFKEVEDEQKQSTHSINVEDELTSIANAKKLINERLPEGDNDLENLPYYNKSLENQEEQKKVQILKNSENIEESNKQDNKNMSVSSINSALSSDVSGLLIEESKGVNKKSDESSYIIALLIMLLTVCAWCFYWFKK